MWPILDKMIIALHVSLRLGDLCLFTTKCRWIHFSAKNFICWSTSFDQFINLTKDLIYFRLAYQVSTKLPLDGVWSFFMVFSLFRRCEWVTFLYVFGYLFFFRTCTYFGFEKPPEHSNAIQLLVTLRVSFKLSFQDYISIKAKNEFSWFSSEFYFKINL